MDIDDLDLYGDLDDFQKSEEKKISELKYQEWNHATKYEESVKTIESLKLEIKDLKKKNRQIEINFQNLLDTAKAEIRRKDKLLDEVRKEKDDICFRRKFPKQARGYQEQQKHQREESADNKNLFKQCSQSLFVTDATKTLSGPSTANYVELTNVIVANESETACRSNCVLPERESRKRDRAREAEGRQGHGSRELEGKQRHIGHEVKVGHRSRDLGQHNNDARDRDARGRRYFAEKNRRSSSWTDYKHKRGQDRRETERQPERPREGIERYPKEKYHKPKEGKVRISHDEYYKKDSAHCNDQGRETTVAKKLEKSKVNQVESRSSCREEETQRDNYSEMCEKDRSPKITKSSSTMKMISEQQDNSNNVEEETKQFAGFVKADGNLAPTRNYEELSLKCPKSTKADSITDKEVLEESCIDLLTLSPCDINSIKIPENNIKNTSPIKVDLTQYHLGQTNSSSPTVTPGSGNVSESTNRKINVKEEVLRKSVEGASERGKEIKHFESFLDSETIDCSSTSFGNFCNEQKKLERPEIVNKAFYDLTSDTDENESSENIRIPNIYEVRMTARLNLARRNMKEKKREVSATKECIVDSIDITDDDNGSILPHNNTNLISIESAVDVVDDKANDIAQSQKDQSTIKEEESDVKVTKMSETKPHVITQVDEKEKLLEVEDSEKQSKLDEEEIQAQVNGREIVEEKEEEKQEALRENCELGEGNQSKERTTQMNENDKYYKERQAVECEADVLKIEILAEEREIQAKLNGIKADLSRICADVSPREMHGSQINSKRLVRKIIAEEKAVKIKEREIHVIESEIQLKPSTTEQKERAIKSKLSQTLIKVNANQSEVQREIDNEESLANQRVLQTKEKDADEAKKTEHQVQEVENKDETQASEGATPANVRETQADIRVNRKQPNKNNIQVRKGETNITKSIENGEEKKEVQTNIETESQVGLNIIPRSKRRDIPVAKRESHEEELTQSAQEIAERKDTAKEEAIQEIETRAHERHTEEKQKKSKMQGEPKTEIKIEKKEMPIGEKETQNKSNTSKIQRRRESTYIQKHSKMYKREAQEEGKETQMIKLKNSNASVTIGIKRRAHIEKMENKKLNENEIPTKERDTCEERKNPPKKLSAIGILRQTALVQQKPVRKLSLDGDNINLQRTKMRKISLDEDQLFISKRDNPNNTAGIRPSLAKYKIPKMSKTAKLPELGKNDEHADECVAKNDEKNKMQNKKTLKELNVEKNDIEKKKFVNIKKRIQNDETISLSENRKIQNSSSSMSACAYRTDEEEGVATETGTKVGKTLETAMQQLPELQNNTRKNQILNTTSTNDNAVDFILNNASFNQDKKQQAAAPVLEEMTKHNSYIAIIEDNIQSKAASKKIKATDTNSTVVEVVKLEDRNIHDENNVEKSIATENVHSFEKKDAGNNSKKSFSHENITKNGNEILLKAVTCTETKNEHYHASANTKEIESYAAASMPTINKSSQENHCMHKSKTQKHKRRILDTPSDEDDVPVQINTKKSLSKFGSLTTVQNDPLNNSLLRLSSDLTDDTNTAVHETLQADTQTTAPMSVCQSPQDPTDEKFRLLDSDLYLIFQSPDHKLIVSTPNKLDDFNISQSPPTNSANVATETTATNVTIEETANASKLLQQGCETSLNDSNASMETKHMSLGSSDYRFERVNENVINLFISRKRRRGGTKKRQLAGDDEQHTFS